MCTFSSMLFAVAAFVLFSAVSSLAEPSPRPALSKAKALAIYAPRPEIPAEVRAKHLSGAGVCVVYVRPDGVVSRAEMLQSTGQPILDKVSIDAFSKWRFKPGTVKKVKIPIRYTGNYPKPNI
jgi:TonB family protein